MSMNAGDQILNGDIKNFKNHVKSEMTRRAFSNNPYTNTGIEPAYQADFSFSADAGQPARAQHYNETVGYLAAKFTDIYNNWASSRNGGDPLGALQGAYNYLIGTLEADPSGVHNGSHHCRSQCQGLCSTGCGKTCSDSCTVEHGNCSWVLGGQYCNN